MNRRRVHDWQEIARRGRNHAVLCMSIFIEGYRRRLAERRRKWGFTPHIYRQFAGARWFSQREMQEFRTAFVAAERRQPGFLVQNARDYLKLLSGIRSWCRRIEGRNFRTANNRELAETLEAYADWWVSTARFVYNYILINDYLAKAISEAVMDRQRDTHRQMQDVFTMITPFRKTEARLEKEELTRLAQRLRSGQLRLDTPVWKKAVQGHLGAFAHLNRYVFYGKSYTAADIRQRVRALLKGDHLKRQIRELRASEPNEPKIRRRIRAYRFDRRMQQLIAAARWWAYVPNCWDETFISVVHRLQPLFREIGRRLGLTYDELIELRHQEVLAYLKGKPIPRNIHTLVRERYRDSAQILEYGRVRLLSTSALRAYYGSEQHRLAKEPTLRLRELKGQAASPGMARGRVAVVMSVKEIGKVRKGQILVTPATTPMHVPAMEKAVAIITDEGGLLSHAAIVSRELHVPCVVGLKIATKVFKDGDRVEVDANTGIVRKL